LRKNIQLRTDTVFYGAGMKMRNLLVNLEFYDIEFSFRIWDKNADRIKKIDEYTVSMPDFDTPAEKD